MHAAFYFYNDPFCDMRACLPKQITFKTLCVHGFWSQVQLLKRLPTDPKLFI